MKRKIHFNCDMGEGLQNEAEFMPYIQAANIACGGHAGDSQTMAEVLQLAFDHQVEIGVHPSYPDKENFGRRKMRMENVDLKNTLERQFDVFFNISHQKNIPVKHIKAHGALYHALSEDNEIAQLFLGICKKYLPNTVVYASPNSPFVQLAKSQGIEVMAEGFADRGYLSDGKLIPRSDDGAIIHEAQQSYDQVYRMWHQNEVLTQDGSVVHMQVDTICVHSDHPNALDNIKWFWKKYQ